MEIPQYVGPFCLGGWGRVGRSTVVVFDGMGAGFRSFRHKDSRMVPLQNSVSLLQIVIT